MAVYTKGMDDAAVSDSAGRLEGFKNELTGIMGEIDRAVGVIKENWGGEDANRFSSDWQSKKPSVQACIDALSQMANKCRENVSAQQSTSNN